VVWRCFVVGARDRPTFGNTFASISIGTKARCSYSILPTVRRDDSHTCANGISLAMLLVLTDLPPKDTSQPLFLSFSIALVSTLYPRGQSVIFSGASIHSTIRMNSGIAVLLLCALRWRPRDFGHSCAASWSGMGLYGHMAPSCG
jgi:hypothetical protein